MANSYYSTQEAAGIAAVYGPGAFIETFSFALADTQGGAGFALGDTLELVQIPANCALIDFHLDCPQLDSNGAPTVTLDLGDAGNAQRYLAAAQLGRSASNTLITPVSAAAAANGGWRQGALPYRYSAADNLVLKIHSAPATPAAAGTITGYALFWGGQNQ